MNVQVDNLDNVTPEPESHTRAAWESLESQLGLGCGRNLELSEILPCLADGCAQHQTGWRRGRKTPDSCALAKLDPASSQRYSPPVRAVCQGLM